MNRDATFVRIQELQSSMNKLKLNLRTANSRFKVATKRYKEALSVYSEADAIYTAKEVKLRAKFNAMVTSNPGFRVNFATNLVAALQCALQQGQQQLNQVEQSLKEHETHLERAYNILQTAGTALTLAFSRRNANVPHVVQEITLPTVLSFAAHEKECKRLEDMKEKASELVAAQRRMILIYKADIARAREAEQEINEIRLRRKREQALHQTMLENATEAMASAKRRMDEIVESIEAMELEILGLQSNK